MKIINIVGARPNFVKIAPIMKAYKKYPEIQPMLVHTGQHYDEKMSSSFFEHLEIPKPDINLEIGSASHAVQTAEIMKAFEPIVLEHRPDAVLVVGDVNSTIACGLVAVKLGVQLLHVEAGLRSFDKKMPEEINRVLTDRISDLFFCTEESGVTNLLNEGVPKEKIHMVGNVMIDSLFSTLEKNKNSKILEQIGTTPQNYAVLTLHRPSNVDHKETFESILDALEVIQKDLDVYFPIHPRTRKNLSTMGLDKRLEKLTRLHLLEPLGYIDFLFLTSSARLVLTDSGGIQEETTALKIPCLTLRENTERPITVTMGSNQVVGTQTDVILQAYQKIKNVDSSRFSVPPFWDGKAAERIVDILIQKN